jgi:ribosomal protein S27AE
MSSTMQAYFNSLPKCPKCGAAPTAASNDGERALICGQCGEYNNPESAPRPSKRQVLLNELGANSAAVAAPTNKPQATAYSHWLDCVKQKPAQ